MMMDGVWWMMVMMGLGVVIFLGLIIGGAYLIIRAIRGDGRPGDRGSGDVRGPSNAAAILEERFARGEIDRDEFEERRRTLGLP